MIDLELQAAVHAEDLKNQEILLQQKVKKIAELTITNKPKSHDIT